MAVSCASELLYEENAGHIDEIRQQEYQHEDQHGKRLLGDFLQPQCFVQNVAPGLMLPIKSIPTAYTMCQILADTACLADPCKLT